MEPSSNPNPNNSELIKQFTEITSSSIPDATFFLESHNYDLDSAISTFFESRNPNLDDNADSPLSRSRSPSPPPSFEAEETTGVTAGNAVGSGYNLRSRSGVRGGNRGSGRITTFADLNRGGEGEESDEEKPQEYYTGGQRSGQVVQDPSKLNDVDSLFEQARQAGAEEGTPDDFQPSSSSRSFAGRGRLLSGETPSAAPQQSEPEDQVHTITFWSNGFTVNDGPLRGFHDPQSASFLKSIEKHECPAELEPARGGAPIRINLVKKSEEYPVKKQRQAAFVGVGRTLGSTTTAEDTTATIPPPASAAPAPFLGLVVDDTLPSTSIQLRLGDGTRMISRFNLHHTISNIRSFIDASRPGGSRTYQLLTMGCPPKQLTDFNQTIEEAGLANSVVIQKL